MASVIFIVLNGYQGAVNLYAITFISGRLSGTTANPQQAAIFLASGVPCLMFLFESYKKWDWIKAMLVGCLVLTALALFLTGSRTGILTALVTLMMFYRTNGGAMVRLGLFASVVLVVTLPFLIQDGTLLGANYDINMVADRFTSGENTRADVWSGMWRAFSNNPLFGAPLQGDRLGYGENSWLAAGAALGLMGFIPLVLFTLECLKMMLDLNGLSKRHPKYFLHCSTVIAALASLLIGSVFEAFLLGNLSSFVLTLLIYLSLGQYLMEVEKREQATLQHYAIYGG
ncbi:MAG: O-antigen ligase family protein [Moorea sp. SIO4G2]|nr:O-antigen ligase family protein [Moorena sp. SIO4G2]